MGLLDRISVGVDVADPVFEEDEDDDDNDDDEETTAEEDRETDNTGDDECIVWTSQACTGRSCFTS